MTSNLKIRVRLPIDRTKTGQLELIDPLTGIPVFGPVPVLGRAARNTAQLNGNPRGESTLPYGDTPLGTYDVSKIVSNGLGTSRPIDQYGGSGSLVLDPKIGDAATAKTNGRVGLLIHSGRQPNSPTPLPSHLKPTNGCLRMLEGDLKLLIDSIRSNSYLFPGRLSIEVGTLEGPSANVDETIEDQDPPPMTGEVLP